MKVFVSGATGVVGRRAVRELGAAGHEVTAVARSDAKAEQVRSLGAEPITVDLFDPTAVKEAVGGHDVIINLATKIPPVMESRKASAWDENDRIRIEGSRNLVDAAIATGATRFIQESIAFLYDDHGDGWIDEDEPQIDSPFSEPVATAERNTRRFADAGGTGVVLRFGMFYAAGSSHTEDLIRYARRGWFPMPGPAGAYQPMIDADDAATAVLAALTVPSGVFNVVDDVPLTRAEMAATAAATFGRKKVRTAPRVVSWIAGKKAPNLVTSQRVSNRRFREASGWSPAHPSLREGLPAVLAEVEGGSS